MQRYSDYQTAQEARTFGRYPRGQRIWPPIVGLADLPDSALLHARLVPSAIDRHPSDPELSDTMDARLAGTGGWKPRGTDSDGATVSEHGHSPRSTDVQAALAALVGARAHITAEQGLPGRVDLHDLTGGNPLAMRLLSDALGHPATRVRKRSARSAIMSALSALDGPPQADRPGTTTLPGSPVTNEPADRTSPEGGRPPGALVRRLTADGLRRAREFLAEIRERPTALSEPPRDLLYDERYSRPFQPEVWIERRSFRTRREAAEYFAPKLASIRHLVADHAGVWSWLGMYYFAETVRVEDGEVRLSPLDETFVVHREDTRSYMLRFRHYLWGAWRLYEMHGETAAFLLNQELTSFGDIAQRTFGAIRIFNSAGIVPLILRLYTKDGQQKRGFGHGPGGLRHLLRVLDQLERTYDVYGMAPDALARVLPDEFRRWDGVAESAPDLGGTNASDSSSVRSVDDDPPAGDHLTPASDSATSSVPARAVDEAGLASVEVTIRELVDARARIQALEPVTWVDLRGYLEEGSECWKAYVSAHGIPETRLFRDIALSRLADAIQSIGGG
ncbi:MAG: hypothetical protein OXG79_09345 [Chloroflexi bacterium]|nr:hypothetical protein [Chloroflexota bacterium]